MAAVNTTIINPKPDVQDIILNRRLVSCFQQIVSVSRKTVIGVEGLIRGVDVNTNALIFPKVLFEAAKEVKLALQLDRACRDTILEAFSEIHQSDPDKLLFLNLDASILEVSAGSGYLLNQVQQYHIDPHNVVIEISEKDVISSATLKKFADTYRKHGFMVALDDVGTGFSNMDRILLVKPDIIKIDISLIKNIHHDFYKQGVFKSLVIMANKIGALVIAEGVENEDDAVQVLRLGGHMIQGFYFSIPLQITSSALLFQNIRIEQLNQRFNEYINLQYMREKNKYKCCNQIVRQAVQTLSGARCGEYETRLTEITAGSVEMECAYILDSTGVQISETVCGRRESSAADNRIFYSAVKGTDHSMEKYYYPLINAKRRQFATEPYISLATGNLCITVSAIFYNADNAKCILCADFTTTEDSYNIELRGPVLSPVLSEKHEMAGLLNQMSEALITDSLTGAYNRRYIDERLLIDIYNASLCRQPLSIILADVDWFKDVNDQYGHLAGDHVLRELVQLSRNSIRQDTDWIARYGGDEFLIVLVNADETAARRVSEDIRCACEQAAVAYGNATIRFTVSMGTYTLHSTDISSDELIRLADQNLYVAKNCGRNRSVDMLEASECGR